MDNREIKETLEKQLQLLAERSKGAAPPLLCELTEAMIQIARVLIFPY